MATREAPGRRAGRVRFPAPRPPRSRSSPRREASRQRRAGGSGAGATRRPRAGTGRTPRGGPLSSAPPGRPGPRPAKRRCAVASDSGSTQPLDGRTTHLYSLPRMIPERAVTLVASDGAALEARLALPPTPSGGIVICHPHPLYGGDMDNPVVVRVVEVCAEFGFATLRFNFRGVGRSTGIHGGGRDEQRDIEAAVTHLRDATGAGVPLALAGYSFGATVAAQVVARPEADAGVTRLALIGSPVAVMGNAPFLALPAIHVPLPLVAGSPAENCPRDALEALRGRLPHAAVTVIDGANHFFFGKLFPLGEPVAGWTRRLQAPQPSRRGGRSCGGDPDSPPHAQPRGHDVRPRGQRDAA